MSRMALYFKISKSHIRLNQIQEICPYLTENRTAAAAKTKWFMLLIEFVAYAESSMKNTNVLRAKMQR